MVFWYVFLLVYFDFIPSGGNSTLHSGGVETNIRKKCQLIFLLHFEILFAKLKSFEQTSDETTTFIKKLLSYFIVMEFTPVPHFSLSNEMNSPSLVDTIVNFVCHHRESGVFYRNFTCQKYFHSRSFPFPPPLVLSLVGSFLFPFSGFTERCDGFCVVQVRNSELSSSHHHRIFQFLLKDNFLGNIISLNLIMIMGRRRYRNARYSDIRVNQKFINKMWTRKMKYCPGRSA